MANKVNPGVRALLHFFARVCDDHSSLDEWDGFHLGMLRVESEAWHEANAGFDREQLNWADDNKWNCDRGAHIFHFGAYGDHHVIAFGTMDDALEDAAGTLKPGYFADVELPDNYESMSDEEQDAAHNEATTDLTYTEAGYLRSWEWSACFDVSPQDVIGFIYAGEAL